MFALLSALIETISDTIKKRVKTVEHSKKMSVVAQQNFVLLFNFVSRYCDFTMKVTVLKSKCSHNIITIKLIYVEF